MASERRWYQLRMYTVKIKKMWHNVKAKKDNPTNEICKSPNEWYRWTCIRDLFVSLGRSWWLRLDILLKRGDKRIRRNESRRGEYCLTEKGLDEPRDGTTWFPQGGDAMVGCVCGGGGI